MIAGGEDRSGAMKSRELEVRKGEETKSLTMPG
jgi:hypothetical protein